MLGFRYKILTGETVMNEDEDTWIITYRIKCFKKKQLYEAVKK